MSLHAFEGLTLLTHLTARTNRGIMIHGNFTILRVGNSVGILSFLAGLRRLPRPP